MAYTTHKQARIMCQYWWRRYHTLPHWRLLARKKALAESRFWGAIAIKAKDSE